MKCFETEMPVRSGLRRGQNPARQNPLFSQNQSEANPGPEHDLWL
jgi:hypothetical protein